MAFPPPYVVHRVFERDLDLLLLEELYCDQNRFRGWFTSILRDRIASSNRSMLRVESWTCTRHLDIFHSVVTVAHTDAMESANEASRAAAGESDLIWRFVDDQQKIAAVLIEDKVASSARPRQADRYRERGRTGIRCGHWDYFLTVLVAPESFGSHSEIYDVRISIEELMAYFKMYPSPRNGFKLMMLEGMILERKATSTNSESVEECEFLNQHVQNRRQLETLIVWAKERRLPIHFTKTKSDRFHFHVCFEPGRSSVLEISDTIWIKTKFIKKFSPFANSSQIQEFMERLRNLGFVTLSRKGSDGYQEIPVSLLTDQRLGQVVETFDWLARTASKSTTL